MNRISLKDYVAEVGQQKAAEHLGVSQGAISKAIRVGREIFIEVAGKHPIRAEEVKPFPSQRA